MQNVSGVPRLSPRVPQSVPKMGVDGRGADCSPVDVIQATTITWGSRVDRRRVLWSANSPLVGEGGHLLLPLCSQFTGLKLSVENSDCMICSFWFEKRTPGPKLIGAMMPVSTFLVFSSSAIVQAQVGCLPQRSIAAIKTLAAA